MSTRTRFEKEAKGNSEMAYWPLALVVFDRAQGAFAKGPHSETDTITIKLMPKYNTGQKIGSHLLQIFYFRPQICMRQDDTIIEEVEDSRSYGNRSSTDLKKRTGSSNLLFSLQQN